MFGFGKGKKTGLYPAKVRLDERFIETPNDIKQDDSDLTEAEALRVACKESEKPPQDPSRRDIMKKAAGIAAAAMIPGLYGKDAKAMNREDMPPGIANAREWKGNFGVRDAYYNIKNEYTTCGWRSRENTIFDMLNFKGCIAVDKSVAMVEPAFWYLVAETNMMGKNMRFLNSEVKKKSPRNFYFGIGIRDFFGYWKHHNRLTSFSSVEEEFLNSIFSAAGYENYQDLTDRYQKYGTSLETKKELIKEAYKKLASLKHPEKMSKDPDNTYNRWVAALWSATWLVNHYFFKKRKDEGYMVHNDLEMPIIINLTRFKVRGPPKYGSIGNA